LDARSNLVERFGFPVAGLRAGLAAVAGWPRDTQASLDVLVDAANYRIKAVTQVLVNLSMCGSIECESFILSDFALLCALPLRDGCNVLNVIGQRLRPRASESI